VPARAIFATFASASASRWRGFRAVAPNVERSKGAAGAGYVVRRTIQPSIASSRTRLTCPGAARRMSSMPRAVMVGTTPRSSVAWGHHAAILAGAKHPGGLKPILHYPNAGWLGLHPGI